jgi:hypothetical protein
LNHGFGSPSPAQLDGGSTVQLALVMTHFPPIRIIVKLSIPQCERLPSMSNE